MEEKLERMKRQSEQVQRRLDSISGLIWLLGAASTPRQEQLLRECLQIESEALSRESASFDNILKDIKARREEMKRFPLVGIFVIVLLALLFSVTSAQEVTPDLSTPTAEATAEPTAEVTPVPEPDQPTFPPIDWPAVMPYLTQIILAGITGFVVLAGTAIVVAGRGAPPWVRSLFKGTVDSGFKEAEKIVDKTPETWDNELLMDLKRKVDALFEQMNQPAPPPTTPGNFG